MAIAPFQFAAIILGAGRSSRMGRPKLLLPWGATTVLAHLASQWAGAGASQLAVVRAADDEALERERLRGAPTTHAIVNPEPARGMFSSIRCAAEWRGWNTDLTHWVLALGDQPHLQLETYKLLIAAAKEEPESIWQPSRGGRPRHPVLLPGSAILRLRSSTAPDLKHFLSTAPEPRRTAEIADPGLDLDMDTPEDYQRAKQFAGLA